MSFTALKPVLTPEGWELLNSLPPYDAAASAELNKRLRREGWDPEITAAALTQSQLRAEARRKFGEFADRMLLTREGLQQSTRLPVAARHASRFTDAGAKHVADLGCGLGGDSMAFAAAGLAVTAVEADETTAAAATINLRPFPEAQVVQATAEAFLETASRVRGVWLDPARRDERRGRSGGSAARLWDPEEFSPPLSFVTDLAATGVPLGVKLGPGIPHELIPDDCEAEWVSIDGELVEVVLWFNDLARPGVRRAATALSTGNGAVRTAELTASSSFGKGIDPEPAGRDGFSGILWEPDPAVIRAGLVAELAEKLGAHLLDEHIAYLCGSRAHNDGAQQLARGHRILDVQEFKPKALKRWASQEGVTSLEIRKRGVDIVPEQLRRQLLTGRRRTKAPVHRDLVITRIGEERLVAVVEPL
ncbi:THUMP-like domain-containing protein [Nesterenkonia populi]